MASSGRYLTIFKEISFHKPKWQSCYYSSAECKRLCVHAEELNCWSMCSCHAAK